MAHSQSRKLDAGNPFPDFTINLSGLSQTTVKAVLSGGWSVLLIYRGRQPVRLTVRSRARWHARGD